jgi:hypothetical protein
LVVWVGLRILESLRLLAAALLCAAYLAAFTYGFVTDRDTGWPASVYPMFSDGRTHHPLRAYRVFGVTRKADGQSEERIYTRDLKPLDALRLLDGLTRMTRADQVKALGFVLSMNPRFTSVRLYEETWQAGGEKLLGRELIADVVR